MTGFDGVLVLVNECIFRGPKFDPYLFMYGNPSVDGRLLFAYLHRRPTDRWIRCILQQKPWDFQSDQITQPEFCGFFLVSIWFLISYSYPIKLYYHLTSCQIKSNVAISCGIVLNIPSYIVPSHLPIYIFFFAPSSYDNISKNTICHLASHHNTAIKTSCSTQVYVGHAHTHT